MPPTIPVKKTCPRIPAKLPLFVTLRFVSPALARIEVPVKTFVERTLTTSLAPVPVLSSIKKIREKSIDTPDVWKDVAVNV